MRVVRGIGGGEVDQEVEACPPVQTAVTRTETEMGDGGDEDGALATLETEIETVTTLKAKTSMATPIEVLYLTRAERGTGIGTADPVPRQEIAVRETTEIETGVPIPLRDLGATVDLDLRIEGGLEGIKDEKDLQEVVRTRDH